MKAIKYFLMTGLALLAVVTLAAGVVTGAWHLWLIAVGSTLLFKQLHDPLDRNITN